MNFVTFMRYAALPARPTVLILIAVLALGSVLVSNAGPLGIPLALLLLSWLFQYSYVLLEHVANGARAPPRAGNRNAQSG